MSLRTRLASASLIAACVFVPVRISAQTGFGGGAYRPGDGTVTKAEPLKTVSGTLPQDAQAAKKWVKFVRMEAVVNADGTVGDVRVLQSLDTPIESAQVAEAIKALKSWRFRPATVAGRTVAVTLGVNVPFEAAQAQTSDDDFAKGAYAANAPDLVVPVLLKSSEPKYTSDALRNKIQGEVELEIIVGTQGTVTKARVVKSLDKQYGLDDEAVKAVKSWLFKPGTLKGQPVAVDMRVTVQFRLY